MSYVTTCPHCRARYADVPPRAAGGRIVCRACGDSFEVVLESSGSPASPPPTVAESPEAVPRQTPLGATAAADAAHETPATLLEAPATLVDDGSGDASRPPPAGPASTRRKAPAVGAAPPEPPPAAHTSGEPPKTSSDYGTWQAGEVILGLYEVVDLVGEGGMGRVYRVHHRGWDVDLAVKSPLPALVASPGGLQSFVQEAETWVNLGLHPNIVSCFYVRNVAAVPHLFAEFVGGGSLHQWIKKRRLGNTAQLVDIAIQLAWGLGYAHQQGLVHQDVKPANVMLTADGDAKITDFGLARAGAAAHGPAVVVDGGTRSVLVSSGGMTPAYCSPEQQAGTSLTRRSDVWSWGVSLLEAFVGEVTWRSGVVAPQVLDELRRNGGLAGAPALPTSLAELLSHCLQTDPQQRPATMEDVAAELVEIYRELTGLPYPRQQPRAGRDTADSLNNRAISLLDLGRAGEAEQLWRQAQGRQAHHAEATYNACIHAWRHGEMSDREVVQKMQELEHSQTGGLRGTQLLGKIHLALADYRRAVDCLDQALSTMPDHHELHRDHALALWGLAAAHDAPDRWRAAQVALAQAIRTTRPDARMAVAYAAGLCDTGNESDALAYYHRARSEIAELPLVLADAISSFDPRSDVLQHWQPFAQAAQSIALSRDGGTVAAAGDSDRILIWDAATGTARAKLKLASRPVSAIALTPTGDLLLVAAEQQAVSVMDGCNGHRLRSLQPHQGRLTQLVVAVEGSCAAAGSSDRRVRLWELASGRLLLQMEGHTGAVTAVDLDRHAARIVSGSLDGSVRVWETAGGACLHVLSGHRGKVNAVAISGDGARAVSGGDDGELRLWDLERGSLIRTLRGHSGGVSSVSFGANESAVASASADGSVRRWQLASGSPEIAMRFPGEIRGFAVAADDSVAVASLVDGVRLVRPFSREPYALPYALSVPVPATEASDRTRRFEALLAEARELADTRLFPRAVETLQRARAIAGFERDPEAIELWQRVAQRFPRGDLLGAWERLSSEQLGSPVTALGSNPTSPLAAIGLADGRVATVDLVSGELRGPWKQHGAMVSALAFSRDGTSLFSASWDHEIRLLDPLTGDTDTVFKGHTDYVLDLAASPDNRHLLSVGSDGTLRWWLIEASEVSEILTSRETSIAACAISPDGCYAVTADWDGALLVWDLHTKSEIASLGDSRHPANAVDISPDGVLAVTAGVDRSIRLWDLRSGRCLRVLTGHQDQVNSVRFSPDGRCAASAGNDGTVRLWDLRESRAIRVFEGHNQSVTSVAFDATGTSLLSGGYDAAVRIWHLDWDPQLRATGWDDHARPYLEIFLHRRLELDPLPITGDTVALGRDDLRTLHRELMKRGFGWLAPAAVRDELQQLANAWDGATSAWRAIREQSRSRRGAAPRRRRRPIPRRLAIGAAGVLATAALIGIWSAVLRHTEIDPTAAQREQQRVLAARSPDYSKGLAARCRGADLSLMLRWSLDPLESSELSVSCLVALADESTVVTLADRLRELDRLAADEPDTVLFSTMDSYLRHPDGSPLVGAGVTAQHELVRIRSLCFTVFQAADHEHLPLLEHYLRDPSSELRAVCAEALAARHDSESADILIRALNDGDEAHRLSAARVLPGLVATQATTGFRLWAATRTACSDSSAAVRAAAAPALGLFTHRRSEQLLQSLCTDPDAATRLAAQTVLHDRQRRGGRRKEGKSAAPAGGNH